jgi:organic hydroperoxide reductase OsmC/OhrA
MSEHKAVIRWRNSGTEMDYERYSRDHSWEFEGGPEIPASAAAAYKGGPGRVDPEEALVAAASSCHMLTFLAIAARRKLVVVSYVDRAVGHMEENAKGLLAVTRIELHPQINFGPGTAVTAEELRKLHDLAHHGCFIANSIRAAITVS